MLLMKTVDHLLEQTPTKQPLCAQPYAGYQEDRGSHLQFISLSFTGNLLHVSIWTQGGRKQADVSWKLTIFLREIEKHIISTQHAVLQ